MVCHELDRIGDGRRVQERHDERGHDVFAERSVAAPALDSARDRSERARRRRPGARPCPGRRRRPQTPPRRRAREPERGRPPRGRIRCSSRRIPGSPARTPRVHEGFAKGERPPPAGTGVPRRPGTRGREVLAVAADAARVERRPIPPPGTERWPRARSRRPRATLQHAVNGDGLHLGRDARRATSSANSRTLLPAVSDERAISAYLFRRKDFGLCAYWPTNAELLATTLISVVRIAAMEQGWQAKNAMAPRSGPAVGWELVVPNRQAQTAGLQVVESEELMVDREAEARLLRVGPAGCAVPSNAIARGVDAWHGEGGGVLRREEKPAGLPVNGHPY